MKNAEREIVNENAILMKQLQELKAKRNKHYSKTKGRANALQSTKFTPRAKVYNTVNSRLDYETAKDKMQYKKEHYAQLREELELRGCTFKPNVDINSMTLTQKNPLPPIEQRNVPDRYRREVLDEKANMRTQELNDMDFATLVLPNNSGKKLHKDFYKNKLEWVKHRDEKREHRRLDNTKAEEGTFIGQPQINDYSNNKIVAADKLDTEVFLARVPKYLKRNLEIKKALENKMYDYTYQPALYRPGRTGEINIQG